MSDKCAQSAVGGDLASGDPQTASLWLPCTDLECEKPKCNPQKGSVLRICV